MTDRPGHDRRYAIDASKIERELGWRADETFETGIARPCAGTLTTALGGNHILDAGYKAERIGLARKAEASRGEISTPSFRAIIFSTRKPRRCSAGCVFGANGQVGREIMRGADEAAVGLIRTHRYFGRGSGEASGARPLSAIVNAAAALPSTRPRRSLTRHFKSIATERQFSPRPPHRPGLPLVQISTDYVFDGAKRTPYRRGRIA